MDDRIDEDEIFIKRWLTVPGRLLLLLTIFAGGAAFYWLTVASLTQSQGGLVHVLMWRSPVLLISGTVFAVVAWSLEQLGIPIYRPRVDNSSPESEAGPPGNDWQ